tara:strand:- start:48 stop:401 length:354 start_codon:yes stop_codon:yes gene_type:complete
MSLTLFDKTMKMKAKDARGKLTKKDVSDFKEMKSYLKPSVAKQINNMVTNLGKTIKSKAGSTKKAIAKGKLKQAVRTVGKMDGGVKAQRIAKKGGNPDIQKKQGFVGQTRDKYKRGN